MNGPEGEFNWFSITLFTHYDDCDGLQASFFLQYMKATLPTMQHKHCMFVWILMRSSYKGNTTDFPNKFNSGSQRPHLISISIQYH